MESVRIGIVGLGTMGLAHARAILDGSVPRLTLAAVVDPQAGRTEQVPGVTAFPTADGLIASGAVDAVLIATPHYSHTTIGIAALQAGLHVLVEKPISVHKAVWERLIGAHRGAPQVFAAMFNQRTDGYYRSIRELVRGGELGEIRRINWIITDWFRTEAYYASSPWRATWAGEGGGVLLNQCPHNLDLLQWIFGLPQRIRAFCGFGRYHGIEVEDDVTAYLEFANGATGVFLTSTGEAPGTNRLEITAENGRIVYESDQIRYSRNAVPMSEFNRTSERLFARPEVSEPTVPAAGHGGQLLDILRNFTAAILDGEPLIAPAAEGIHSVELANAMLMSTWLRRTVDLPLDASLFERLLKHHIDQSTPKKRAPAGRAADDDFAASFGR